MTASVRIRFVGVVLVFWTLCATSSSSRKKGEIFFSFIQWCGVESFLSVFKDFCTFYVSFSDDENAPKLKNTSFVEDLSEKSELGRFYICVSYFYLVSEMLFGKSHQLVLSSFWGLFIISVTRTVNQFSKLLPVLLINAPCSCWAAATV